MLTFPVARLAFLHPPEYQALMIGLRLRRTDGESRLSRGMLTGEEGNHAVGRLEAFCEKPLRVHRNRVRVRTSAGSAGFIESRNLKLTHALERVI